MSQTSKAMDNETIDLKQLFFTIAVRWKFILLCILMALVSALLYLRITAPIYAVNGLVQVDDSKNSTTALLGDMADLMQTKSPAQTELEVIKSRLILLQAVKNLNLDIRIHAKADNLANRLFRYANYRTLYSRDAVEYGNDQGLKLTINGFNVSVLLRNQPLVLRFSDDFNYRLTLPNQQVLTGKVGKPLHVQVGDHLLRLEIAQAHRVTGKVFTLMQYAEQTAVDHVTAKLSAAEKGKLTGVINLAYQGPDKILITQTLNEILRVYTKHNVARKSAETQNTLMFLEKQLPELRQQLEQAESRFNAFREQNNTVDVTRESELLIAQNVDLETKRMELEQKRAELGGRFTQDYPQMQQINAQLKSIADRAKELNNRLNQLPEIQRQYLQLYRDVQINTELYTSLQNSYQQLKVVKAGQIGNIYVLDHAILPLNPVKPKTVQVLVLSVFLGGFIGILLVILRNMLRSGIKDSREIEEQLDLPVYATIPHSPLMAKTRKNATSLPLLAIKDSEDVAIESLRSIRTVLHFAQLNATNNAILITGPSPEIGKSFISANLAAILTQSGSRVLLIDGDLRRGYLHKFFKASKTNGLADLIASPDKDFAGAVQSTPVPGLDFISRGASPVNPSELLISQRFKDFMTHVNALYDYVILDAPPLLAVTDGVILSEYVGVTLMVARYGQTHIRELELSVAKLDQANQKAHGVILNDVTAESSYGYGYGYGYNYNYNYRSRDE